MTRKKSGHWDNFENCKKDALKYQTRSDWQRESGSAFYGATRNGWREICCAHMKRRYKPLGYWSYERCKVDAKKYKSRSEWQENSGSAYIKAHLKGWLDECCSHMEMFGNKKSHKPNQHTKAQKKAA